MEEIQVKLSEQKKESLAKLSQKDKEMSLTSDKLCRQSEDLQRKLDQVQLDNDLLLTEKSDLTDKVLLHFFRFYTMLHEVRIPLFFWL